MPSIRTIRGGILLLLAAGLLPLAAGMGWWGSRLLRASLERELEQRGLVLVRMLALIGADAERDKDGLGDFMTALLADPDVEEAVVFSAEGLPVAFKVRDPGAGSVFPAEPAAIAAASLDFAPRIELKRAGGRRYRVLYQRLLRQAPAGEGASPFAPEAAGACRLTLGYYRIERFVARTQRVYLLVLAGLLLSVGALAGLFARRISRPLAQIQRAAAAIGRGDFSWPLPVELEGEIGELARELRGMAGAVAVAEEVLQVKIRRSTAELDAAARELGLLAAITRMSPLPIIMTGVDRRVRVWNEAAQRLFGWTLEEALGRDMIELLVPEAARAGARAVIDAVDRGESVALRVERRTKSGETIPVELHGAAVPGPGGRILGRVGVLRDLREVERLQRVAGQSERLAAVGQLAAGIAHEINNPMGVILGFAQSALKRIEDPGPLALPLRSIEREALRCKKLVESLLGFARDSAWDARDRFDLVAAVDSALALVLTQARVRSVELVKDLGAGPLPVWGDSNGLQQVVINLCLNAIDAMPGGGTLAVRLRRPEPGPAGRVELVVSDTGTGIPETIRGRIFDPFFTTKEPGKGTGLGLALAHDIVGKHGGEISFESRGGGGTIFTVALPAAGP